jgi:hypothetical protein
MMHTLSWSTLQERRLKARLQMFHKIVNDKIEIPYENILIKSQSKTRSTHNQTFRQIQCNKDSYNFSFFCRTIKDWNQLPKNITIQKRVVRNKFDIYVFITTFIYLFIILQFFIYYKIKTKYIFYWRYGKVLRSSSCERLSLNASVVALFVIFFGN